MIDIVRTPVIRSIRGVSPADFGSTWDGEPNSELESARFWVLS
jgi:hypothetical protein